MANFRNKQWFKNMTDEKKEELCKKLGCSLQGLKKAGFQDEDGKIKIDLLRLEMEFPSEEWQIHLDVIESKEFWKVYNHMVSLDEDDIEETLKSLEEMYCLWEDGLKFLKADTKKLITIVWVKQCKLSIIHNIEELELYLEDGDSVEKKESMMTISRKIFLHLSTLFESDLNNVKRK